MIAVDFDVTHVDQVLRLVRALGAHRYVAGRLHLAHALGIASIGDDAGATLADARTWAIATLEHPPPDLEVASRDDRLWRRCSDAEIVALLDAYWTPGERAQKTRSALRALLERHGLPPAQGPPAAAKPSASWAVTTEAGGLMPDGLLAAANPFASRAFDESVEDRIHPLALDAGWQLLDLRELDPERHKGAIAAFGDELAFASALFEEETAIPPAAHLCELPAIGALELLHGVDATGTLAQPFVIWTEGNDTYMDYVLRGVRRAAKLDDR